MTPCDLFEREGLLQLEQGATLDPHFETCPDCLEARRRYALLTQAIGDLDAAAAPSPFWQTRVWATIREQRSGNAVPDVQWESHLTLGSVGSLEPTAAPAPEDHATVEPTLPRGRRWSWWLAPLGAVAALAVFMVWLFPASSPLPAVFLATEIHAGQTVVSRGQDAHPGDELRLHTTVGAFAFAELRVYFNDNELPVHCSTDPPCRRDGDTLSLVTTLKSLGTYRPVLIVSANPIPAPSGNLDQDAGAALRSGATVQAGDPIPVR